MDSSSPSNDNTASKYVPPHLRNRQPKQVSPLMNKANANTTSQTKGFEIQIDEEKYKESVKRANPYKMNFAQALRSNNKDFEVKKSASSQRTHHYDYVCASCSKLVKREGLNCNNTNYCWQCHSEIIFKGKGIIITDDEDGEYIGEHITMKQRYEMRYEQYLLDQRQHNKEIDEGYQQNGSNSNSNRNRFSDYDNDNDGFNDDPFTPI